MLGSNFAIVVTAGSTTIGRSKNAVDQSTSNTTNTDRVAKAATAATQVPIGVTLEPTAAADEQAAVRTGGIALVDVDGSGTAIDIGTPIMATTGGQGIAAATGGSTAQWVIGTALEPSAADGDEIAVLLHTAYYPVGS